MRANRIASLVLPLLILSFPSSAISAACVERETYSEDFETGWAANWYFNSAFQIAGDSGAKKLIGGNDALATYLYGDHWVDFTLAFKMKLTSGETSVSIRYNSDSSTVDIPFDRTSHPVVSKRYSVRFTAAGAALLKEDAGSVTTLGSASSAFDSSRTYSIAITAEGGTISLFVNDAQLLNVTDPNPVRQGSIALETKGSASVQFDDLQVAAKTPCEHTWTRTKTYPVGPDINVIAFNPSDSNIVYAGTEHAGVWKSSDAGLTWSEVGYSGGMGRLGKMTAIAVAPTDAKTVYAAWVAALDKSSDGGAHWTRTSIQETTQYILGIAVSPSDSKTVYVAQGAQAPQTSNQGVLLKTSDGGSTYETILNSPALAIAGSSSNVLYIGTNTGVSKSTNGGSSWSAVYTYTGTATGGVSSLAVDPSNANAAYLVAPDGAVMKTTDGGSNWRKVRDGGNLIIMSRSRPDVLYLIAGDILRSADGGTTWTATKRLTTKPYTLKTLAVDPSNPDKVIAGTWGQGVFISSDGGGTWSSPNTFAGPADLGVAIGVHPTDAKKVYVGTSKGEMYVTSDGGDTWTFLANLGSGNTYQSLITGLVIDPLTPTRIYASNVEGVFRSSDGGLTWKAINTGLTDTRIISLAIDPKTPSTLYAGTGNSKPRNITSGTGMFVSTNGGDSWSKVSGLPDAPIPAIVVSPLNTSVIYAGLVGSGIHKSINAGSSWTQVNSGLESTSCVYTLAMDPGNPDVAYAGTNNGASCQTVPGKLDKIYKTTDGGKNWKIVRKAAAFYENIESLAVDPANPNNVYAAGHTERIWYSNDAGATWSLANGGVVRHGTHLYLWVLAFDSTGSTLYMTTCGLGVLRNFTSTPEVPVVRRRAVRH